jgi:UDP-glucuronate 4-epimerase
MQLEDETGIMCLFEQEHFDIVINLAAQAGGGHSIKFPHTYVKYNIIGFLNIMEACR